MGLDGGFDILSDDGRPTPKKKKRKKKKDSDDDDDDDDVPSATVVRPRSRLKDWLDNLSDASEPLTQSDRASNRSQTATFISAASKKSSNTAPSDSVSASSGTTVTGVGVGQIPPCATTCATTTACTTSIYSYTDPHSNYYSNNYSNYYSNSLEYSTTRPFERIRSSTTTTC